jgi:hypothetical protein
MTRNASLAVFALLALTSTSRPATALTLIDASSPIVVSNDLALRNMTGGNKAFAATELSEALTRSWVANADANPSPAGAHLNLPSPAAQTETWALVPEPVSWVLLMAGFGGLGARLRVRRGSPREDAQVQARISGSR